MDARVKIAIVVASVFEEAHEVGLDLSWEQAINIASVAINYGKSVRTIIRKRAARRANRPLKGLAIPAGEWNSLFPSLSASLEARQY